MSIVTYLIDDNKESKLWVSKLETGVEKLKHNPFISKFQIKKVKIKPDKVRVSVNMKLSIPHFYIYFLIYPILPYLLGWPPVGYIPALIGLSGIFWSPLFLSILIRMGLFRAGYTGTIDLIKTNDLLEVVYFGSD